MSSVGQPGQEPLISKHGGYRHLKSFQIAGLLRGNPYMSLAEVAEEIGRSLRAVERAVTKLAGEGRLR